MATINLSLTKEIIEIKKDSVSTIKTLRDNYKQIYTQLTKEVEEHSKSKYSIPEVTAKIGKTGISALQAMKAVNEAAFEGQKLSNIYNIYYAPKLNEIFWDCKAIIATLSQEFNQEPAVQEIKTSAEKDRQRSSFCFDADIIFDEVKKFHDNLYYLGKYVENIVYSLDRMQKMIDSLDRLASREMWVDIKAQDDTLNHVISDKDTTPDKTLTHTDTEDWDDFN